LLEVEGARAPVPHMLATALYPQHYETLFTFLLSAERKTAELEKCRLVTDRDYDAAIGYRKTSIFNESRM